MFPRMLHFLAEGAFKGEVGGWIEVGQRRLVEIESASKIPTTAVSRIGCRYIFALLFTFIPSKMFLVKIVS